MGSPRPARTLTRDRRTLTHMYSHRISPLTNSSQDEGCCPRCGALERHPQEACAWTHDGEGIYDSACGETFQFNAGGPTENSVKFCPYCGKRLALADAPTTNPEN